MLWSLFKSKYIKPKGEVFPTPLSAQTFYLRNRDLLAAQKLNMVPPKDMHDRAALLYDADMANYRVNCSIKPRLERQDTWALHPAYGDCEDYAVSKLDLLKSFTKPFARLCIVKTRAGEYHMVLVLKLGDGDYILDNLNRSIVRWDECPHTFVAIQSKDPEVWLK